MTDKTSAPAASARTAVATADPATPTGPAYLAWNLGGGEIGAALVGLLGLVLALVGAPGALLVVLAVALVVGIVVSVRARLAVPGVGTGVLGRVLLLVAALGYVEPGHPVRATLLVVLAAVTAAELVYVRLVALALPFASHLPGVEVRRSARVPVQPVFLAGLAALVLLVALTVLDAPTVLGALVVLVAAVATGAGVLDLFGLIVARRRAEGRITRVLTAYAPTFALHWDAAAGTGYQIGRWLPYLDRLGERYVVFVRNAASFGEAAALTEHPVLLRRGAREMDPVMVDSLRAVFYVNNALRNVHVVRYLGLRHVQLNHGDSDKATSYNPVFRMFDKNFVAGQAAIDRFAAHDVSTSADFFEIVGRPQVEDVQVAAPGTPVRRVLYAPTWAGMHSDSAYSSLPIGPAIVEALIARDCVVIYRPHPYTNRTPALREASERIYALLRADAQHGRAHVFGDRAEREWGIIDCFNAADALVSDVSSVVPDFLYSEKPFAIAAMGGTVEEFFAEMPVARGGYVIERDGANLAAVVDDLLGADPQADVRRELKTYYLGDLPADGYADAFLHAARAAIGGSTRS